MLYKDFIKPNKNYQYSINIRYDIKNLDKIKSYIPTRESTDILKEYLKSILYNSESASVLVGPYGKGKSHLLLVLVSIVSMAGDTKSHSIFNELINKIGIIDDECAILIKRFIEKQELILPIIISSNYIDIKQAFLLGINEALSREDMEDLIPRTYFIEAIDTIERWKKQYKGTYMEFKRVLSKDYKYSISQFMKELLRYNEEVYKIFTVIHPSITAGTEFNPLISADIIKLYEDLSKTIAENSKFKGIIVIFDEFGKFLESSTDKNSAKDMKIIQDFAEMSVRKRENPIHFICVTHKDIEEYTNNLTKDQINSWRTVSGRFKHTYFVSSSIHNYELIASAIQKDEYKFNSYLSTVTSDKYVQEYVKQAIVTGIFDETDNPEEVIGKGCFPLNPISTFVLPRISEKVAQNERTLFTFISKDEKGTLNSFVQQTEEFKLLNVDWIYDYFKDIFKKDISNEYIHRIWLQSDTILKKCNDKEKIIIKTLAIIYMINEKDRLPPNNIFLKLGTGLNEEEFRDNLNSLLKRSLLFIKSYNGNYYFGSLNNINFKEKIISKVENNIDKIDILKEIKDIMKPEYRLPREYNDSRQITRFFRIEYIMATQFLSIYNDEVVISESASDGIIYNLIYWNEEEKNQVLNHLDKLKSRRLIVCIPNQPFKKINELQNYWAMKELILRDKDINSDESSIRELKILKEDLFENISCYLKMEFDITGEAEYFIYKNYSRAIKDIKNRKDISRFLSEVCAEYYNYTPVIKNELINKDNLTSVIKKARDKVISYILDDMREIEKFTGNSAEATIYRATIKNLGLTPKMDIGNMDKKDPNTKFVIGQIESFFNSSIKDKRCFSIIYDMLRGKGFGLRSGVIPIYLTLYMNSCKDRIILYQGHKEIDLSVENINNINRNPEKYYVFLQEGSLEEKEYISKLIELFKDNYSQQKFSYNKNIFIVQEMQRWFHCLPKYTQQHSYIIDKDEIIKCSDTIIKFRNIFIKPCLNPKELLFDEIPKKIIKNHSLDEIVKIIADIKKYYENHINKFIVSLDHRIINIFSKDYKGTLKSSLKYWYENLLKENKIRLYEPMTNGFLRICKEIDKYEGNVLVNEIAREITGLFIEDWEDDTLSLFMERICMIRDEVERVHMNIENDVEKTYTVISTKYGERQIAISDISEDGDMLYNDLLELIDESTGDMKSCEKVAVLFKLLEKYI